MILSRKSVAATNDRHLNTNTSHMWFYFSQTTNMTSGYALVGVDGADPFAWEIVNECIWGECVAFLTR